MTVNEAVTAAGAIIGKAASRDELILWLGEIENTVICEIAKTHEAVPYDQSVISADGDDERVLFAPDPFSQLYIHYLMMKFDDRLCDTERYMNSASRFSASYQSFADWYNRTYMPLCEGRIRL